MHTRKILVCIVIITILVELALPVFNSTAWATDKNTIKLNYTKYKFENLNATIQLQATFTGEAENITWKSDNENAAVVDQNGKVTPKSPGFSYIRAKGTTCSEECMVYVATPVQLSDGSYGYVGDLDRNGVLDANDASLISEIYKTEQGDKEIADIDGNGVIDVNDTSLLMDIFRFYEFTVPATKPNEQNNDDENEQGNQGGDITKPVEEPQEQTYTNDLEEEDLIRIYNSKTGFDFKINKDTTINEVIAKYGQPKIKTESAFGGYAYTFYTDSKYSNYLYLETTANDTTIMSYGTVWNEYFTHESGYGEKLDFYDNSLLQGFFITNGTDGIIRGGMYYNNHKLIEGSYEKTTELFQTNYNNNTSLYLKSIAKHATTMYNAICTINGYTCNLQFNEDVFYTNEQLKQNGSSIKRYAENNGKMLYLKGIGTRDNVNVTNRYYVLSPMLFADMFFSEPLNKIDMPEQYKYSVFDYNQNNKVIESYVITEDVFKIRDKVQLTSEETSKLNEARSYYNTAMDLLNNNTGSIYKTEPIDNSAESLYAGELKDPIEQAAIAYYNAIRAGQGLSTAVQNETGRKQAQAMAVLQSYRWHRLGLSITHSPKKPTGVTTEFFNSALGYGQQSLTENIAMSNNMEPSTNAIQKFFRQFMDDSSETPFNLSHRTNLLKPSNANLGYGIAKSIGVIEIGHDSKIANGIDISSWPSKGITLLETLDTNRFRWSTQFHNGYEVTSDTTVFVKCIQTGETWFFDTKKDEGYNYFRRDEKTAITELRNRVIFADETLIPQPGFAYEITIGNLNDSTTGETKSYTYRSIFEYGDTSKYSATSTNISIDSKELSPVSGESKTYYIPVGEYVDLDVTLDENLIDKKLTWSRTNNNITLTQSGIVYLDKKVNDKIAVTVTHDSTKASDTVYLRTYDPNQVKLSESDLNITAGETKNLSISELGTEVGTENSIDWIVIKNSSPTKEYNYNDKEIAKYMEITKIDNKNISIKAISASVGDNTFKIIAKVNGSNGTYRGETNLTVKVPLQMIRFSSANKTNKGLSIYTNPGKPYTITINMEDFYELNQTDIIRFKVNYSPSNTTEPTDVTWELLTNNGVLSTCDEKGAYKMNKPGKASIKITSVSNPELTAQLDITITSSTIPTYLKGDVNGNGVVDLTDYSMILKHVKGIKQLNGEELQRADVNENGTVDLTDYSMVLKHVKGIKLLN